MPYLYHTTLFTFNYIHEKVKIQITKKSTWRWRTPDLLDQDSSKTEPPPIALVTKGKDEYKSSNIVKIKLCFNHVTETSEMYEPKRVIFQIVSPEYLIMLTKNYQKPIKVTATNVAPGNFEFLCTLLQGKFFQEFDLLLHATGSTTNIHMKEIKFVGR